ncbi:uncharacterized protein LOC142140469 [Mixophyes fleayi]|uniref:uncharacterized protein LOC142140469 n=1 Tax=Mixophyes fleayi TaxID=3061075 RepID=UPI003F4DAD44
MPGGSTDSCDLSLAYLFLTLVISSNAQTSPCPFVSPEKLDVFAENGSTILLPCNFPVEQLHQVKKSGSAVLWIKNDRDHIVEISFSGEPLFWTTYKTHFHTFPSLAAMGNFSLLIENTVADDYGTYHCKLYEGKDCVAGHKINEVKLGTKFIKIPEDPNLPFWQTSTFLIGCGCGGGVLLLIVIALVVCTVCKRKQERRRYQSSSSSNPRNKSLAAPSKKPRECIYANAMC